MPVEDYCTTLDLTHRFVDAAQQVGILQLRPEHKGQLVRFDHRGVERTMMSEAGAVWAGATEEDAITLRRWMEQRPPARQPQLPGLP